MASITPQQILVPKKVYIGDAAELRCTFNSPSTALKQLTINGTTEIYDFSDNTNISALSDDYDIKSITLSPAGVDFYQLMKNLHIRSFAKINISLNITKKRVDGFHEIDSVMLPISLHDSLVVSKLKNATDNYVTVDDFSIGSFSYNLATFSIEKLHSVYHFNDKFRVLIHKVIPIQAGLGGGSSNAACTMKAVNSMLKLGATDEELIELSKPLGCDIPFFIECKPARVQGVGEILNPINVKNNYYVLIVKPEAGCSTKEVYSLSDTLELKTCNYLPSRFRL